MANTFLVEILKRGGCSYGQAEAFERCLEDRPICGVGPGVLSRCLIGHLLSDADIYVRALQEVVMENRRLKEEIGSMLFQEVNRATPID